jgi:tetratricopeptide (TPR) repeat protein
MRVAASQDERSVLDLNLAAAKLHLEHYYEAHQHSRKALESGCNMEKALFRLGRAAYGMRQWQEAIGHYEALLVEFPHSPRAKCELARAKARLKEAATGEYDLHRLYSESKGGQQGVFLDVADYTGPVKVAAVPGKGKWFCTET